MEIKTDNLTEEQAIALAETKWWERLDPKSITEFQLFEDRLCMPFRDFHEAVEIALGRPVFTHEFAFVDNLRAEFVGDKPQPSFEEILNLIPEEKRIVIHAV